MTLSCHLQSLPHTGGKVPPKGADEGAYCRRTPSHSLHPTSSASLCSAPSPFKGEGLPGGRKGRTCGAVWVRCTGPGNPALTRRNGVPCNFGSRPIPFRRTRRDLYRRGRVPKPPVRDFPPEPIAVGRGAPACAPVSECAGEPAPLTAQKSPVRVRTGDFLAYGSRTVRKKSDSTPAQSSRRTPP